MKMQTRSCLRCGAVVGVLTSAAHPVHAAAAAQASTGSLFDNLLFVVFASTLLALLSSIVGGVVITVLATWFSRFLRENLPTDEELAQFRAELAKPKRRWRLPRLTPRTEPFVLSAVGFVMFFLLSALVLSAVPQPEPVKAEATTPTPQAALPRTGDFGSIIDGLPEGDPDRGARLFVTAGCSGCHSQKPNERLVGPTFYNLWNVAKTRVPSLSAKEYLYQSIVDPNAYVVEGYPPNVMQQNYAAILSPQQMADLLAWIEARHNEEP
ncbi:MAG: cytochrome c [Thermoflexales bacterium]|nr:cytochrome c [Thermoflexales bacterium]MCS7324602.1 cytochrome c [Thermoflexales bacterium]MCX7940078.1 cytochrome c [Thermoflexales bacterium]MDW8053851.1 cytochrome c [Anaerolineae bacterium]MDW8292382.1 cytochrome c [Anaerolineae bacterium]